MGRGPKQWATRGLQPGDLTALTAIAKGATIRDEGRIERLVRRGFVTEREDSLTAITPRGRLALLIRRLTM